jgi:hypothetical protein
MKRTFAAGIAQHRGDGISQYRRTINSENKFARVADKDNLDLPPR